MKKQLLIITLPLAALAITGCGKNSQGADTAPNTSVITGGTITRPGDDTGTGGTPSKATSMEKALNYDYSNVTLGIDTVFNKGENETYYEEYYMGNSIVTYTPDVAANYGTEYAYEEFYVQNGQSYKWFDAQKNVANSKGGWMQKGYKNADLSIWVGNLYLDRILNTLEAKDFKMGANGLYYIEDAQKNSDFIDEVFGWVIYDTEGSAYPIDVAIWLDSETSAFKKIYAFFDETDENTDDSDCVQVEFGYFGETTAFGYQTHEAPNDSNITHYWEYYGWPHDYQPAYYRSLQLNVASEPNDHVAINENEVTMDIDKTFGVNLIKDPNKFEAWDLVDNDHATITYEYDESILEMKASFSYSKEFHSLKAGTTTIKATVLGENDVLIASNEITVTVNAAPVQDLTNAVYKFSWVGFTDEENPTKLFANNDYGNGLPFDITTSDQRGIKILDSANSDIFEDGKKTLVFEAGHAVNAEGKPSSSTSVTFDFDDQQVSEISFNFASFYASTTTTLLSYLKAVTISTSNDGVDWTNYDATETIKEEISADFVKLFDAKFAAASKVKITVEATTCGAHGSLGVENLAFSTDETCHNHDTSEAVAVTGVSLSESTLDVEVGSSSTLVASVSPATATNQSLTWSSSDETAATVADGVVSGLKEGTTTITVTTVDGGFTASCAVTVVAKPTIPEEYAGTYYSEQRDATVVLDATTNTLAYSSDEYNAILKLKKIDNKNLLFVNDSGDKLSVNMSTNSLYFGTSNTSKLNGEYLQGNWDFDKQIEATDFSLSVTGSTANADGTYNIIKGSYVVVTAKNFKPTDANVKNIVWTVEAGTGNGTYDEEYSRFTATQAGTVTLKATMNNSVVKTVSFVVTEPVNVTSISVTSAGGVTEVICDKTLQLTATVNPSNADDKSVTWSSSDTSVAAVSTNGLVMPKTVTENSTVVITATSKSNPSVSGSITITVTPRPAEGVVPAGMVGDWVLSDGTGYFDAELIIKADGTGSIICSDTSFNEDISFDSKSGNEYTFLVNLLGDDYELVVTFDGSSITEVTYDDAAGYMVAYDSITWSTITAK